MISNMTAKNISSRLGGVAWEVLAYLEIVAEWVNKAL